MLRNWRRSSFVFAALSLLVLSGCENAGPLAAPADEPASTRSFGEFEASVVTSAQASGIDLAASEPETPLMSVLGRRFVFVQGNAGDDAVEAVIGTAGGVLNLGDHWLLVPENAVRTNTRFRMEPVNDGTLHVELTATTVRRGLELKNDVGHTGFRTPVYLAFHFGDPSALDASALSVAWLTDLGVLIRQQTFIYEQEWAVGVLRHFSGYVLVAN